MAKANFIFTSYANYFKVKIDNLEKLTVEQIQEIELFVKKRKGIFDFNTYSFEIQKRMEFYQFESLMKNSSLDVRCSEKIIYREAQARVGFGQYKGMQYNELPDSYMLWLKSNYRGYDREKVEKELQKRNL